ncbi:hypothetical protein MP228_008186 [Amoeboaphelidium protococcarum]|nr:hypothetical protein MP228_008186 [Amoeboaphelidium protococcarum]
MLRLRPQVVLVKRQTSCRSIQSIGFARQQSHLSVNAKDQDSKEKDFEVNPVQSNNFYQTIREAQLRHKQHLLMARVGDFYEFYFEQGQLVSQLLNIKLARMAAGSRRADSGQEVVFCGFPQYKMADYVKMLLDQGYSVAKFEQYHRVQNNGERLITRHVDRIFTTGTVVEESLVQEEDQVQSQQSINKHSILSLFSSNRDDQICYCLVDVLSGDFYMGCSPGDQFQSKLSSIRPAEVIISSSACNQSLQKQIKEVSPDSVVHEDTSAVSLCDKDGLQYLDKIFSISSNAAQKKILNDLGIHGKLQQEDALKSCASLLRFIEQSHGGSLPLLNLPRPFNADCVRMDPWTVNSLEIFSQIQSKSSGHSSTSYTLYGLIKRHCQTPSGRGLLKRRLLNPSTDVQLLQRRLDQVDLIQTQPAVAKSIRDALSQYCRYNMAQALQNLALGYGGPWHLGVIHNHLHALDVSCGVEDGLDVDKEQLQELQQFLSFVLPTEYMQSDLDVNLLQKSISKPGVLNPECNPDLMWIKEKYLHTKDQSDAIKHHLVDCIQQLSGVTLSKQSVNFDVKKPLGPYIEIESNHSVPSLLSSHYQALGMKHLQTLGGSSRVKKFRYRYQQWTENCTEVESVYNQYLDVEKNVFGIVKQQVLSLREQLLKFDVHLSTQDLSCAISQLATDFNWTRPKLSAEHQNLSIVGGRHPVLESVLQDSARSYTSNSITLSQVDHGKMAILTGANMGGKSTFLRQNALIVLMAQCGFYVPAHSADIGIVDAIYSRVGSADNLARNQSSFKVEMDELAVILSQCSNKSLVLIDELGRGTSYEDGFALSKASIDQLVTTGCRTLFATHYHKLTSLYQNSSTSGQSKIQFLKADIDVRDGRLFFNHTITPGVSVNSHGIDVARFSGVPQEVIKNAIQFKQSHQW